MVVVNLLIYSCVKKVVLYEKIYIKKLITLYIYEKKDLSFLINQYQFLNKFQK